MDIQYHILYWEGTDDRSITFESEDVLLSWNQRGAGPSRCFSCCSVVDSWKSRLDNMQSSLRMCLDPSGLRFRKDIANFICLSPRMSLVYRLGRFHRYLTASDKLSLTEDNVLGTALSVDRGELKSEACGVEITKWRKDEWGAHETWLKERIRRIRQAADDRGGASAGLMLDKNGFEVGASGAEVAMFARKPQLPIREVVILLGGPKGIDENYVLPNILKIFNNDNGDDEGLHEATLKVKLPGGLQHSYVALGDLLSFHDRGLLLPIMEDYRHLGHDQYLSWRSRMNDAMHNLASSKLGLAAKMTALRTYVDTLSFGPMPDEQDDAPSGIGAGANGAVATPSDVERCLVDLEARGLLPQLQRPWRATLCLASIEPHRALKALLQLEKSCQLAASAGEDSNLWDKLCQELETQLEQEPAGKNSTLQDVVQALSDLRQDKSSPQSHRRLVSAGEVTALSTLPCDQAVRMLQSLYRSKPPPPVPAAAQDGGDVAKEAAFWAARLESGSALEVSLRQASKVFAPRPSKERLNSMWPGQNGHVHSVVKRKLQPRQPAHPPPDSSINGSNGEARSQSVKIIHPWHSESSTDNVTRSPKSSPKPPPAGKSSAGSRRPPEPAEPPWAALMKKAEGKREGKREAKAAIKRRPAPPRTSPPRTSPPRTSPPPPPPPPVPAYAPSFEEEEITNRSHKSARH
eukprot:TRINITY_DN72168_c0_g1_i1.p1 TRINITY_DN72168_c0_g1~~TRINITY_DN72168_c0_g1_i1.p1  ORF type:complete len:690 (+),score=93.81 TRINITY_DN72168_c0_g1_i1:95-2164(+)